MTNNNERMTVSIILRLVKMSGDKYEEVCKELRAAAEDRGEAVKNYVDELLKLTDRMRGHKEKSAATK